jgi:hypothetical protein
VYQPITQLLLKIDSLVVRTCYSVGKAERDAEAQVSGTGIETKALVSARYILNWGLLQNKSFFPFSY